MELLLEYDVGVFIYKNQPIAQYHIRITHGDKANKRVYVSATLVAILREVHYEGCRYRDIIKFAKQCTEVKY